MQNLDLRELIVARVQNNTLEEFTDTITSSVDGDERALPGLGVLFEIIWKDSNDTSQNEMVATLYEHFNSKSQIDNGKISPSF